MKKFWTRRKDKVLRDGYPTGDLDALAAELGVTVVAVKSRAKVLGLRRQVNVKRPFTDSEDEMLRRMYADTDTQRLADMMWRGIGSIYRRAKLLGLEKSAAYMSEMGRRVAENGVATRFKKGMVPANKGRRACEFRTPEGEARCREHQFKAGHRPHNARQVGYETVRGDGYWYVKTEQGRPMVLKHVWLWRQAHGDVPDGMVVTFCDGDRGNCTLENLTLTTRAEVNQRMAAAITPERRQQITEKAMATRNETIRKDYLRIRWGLEPKTRLVKRWHESPIYKNRQTKQ